MTLAALAAVERLVDAGATVVGIRPESSPSLADDPDDFRAACDRLWAAGRVIERGSGGVARGPRAATRAWRSRAAPVRRISRIVDGERVTFVANPTDAEVRLRLTPANSGPLQSWDPVQLQRGARSCAESATASRSSCPSRPSGPRSCLPGAAPVRRPTARDIGR